LSPVADSSRKLGVVVLILLHRCELCTPGETGRAKNRFKIRDLFADERCSRAILHFLATSDVGRRILDTVEENTRSDIAEGEPRKPEEKAEERRQSGGAGG
jgi:hypothetical protein